MHFLVPFQEAGLPRYYRLIFEKHYKPYLTFSIYTNAFNLFKTSILKIRMLDTSLAFQVLPDRTGNRIAKHPVLLIDFSKSQCFKYRFTFNDQVDDLVSEQPGFIYAQKILLKLLFQYTQDIIEL